MPPRALQVGLIGCGGIVRSFHAAAYRALPDLVTIAALADPVPDNLAWARQTFDVAANACFADFQDMVQAKSLDAVVIATPHALHAEQAVACLAAGVAVISEKPMALSLSQADQILDTAARTGQAYAVVHNFLYAPGVTAALSLLRAGYLGPIAYGRAQALFRKRGREQVDPTLNWRASKQAGGGCLNDTIYHEIYLTETLMDSPVRYVQAQVLTQHFAFDVDDLALLMLEHENGAVSTVSGSWWVGVAGAGESANLAEVHGQAGSLRVVRRGRALLHKTAREDEWQDATLEPGYESVADPQAWSGHAGFFAWTFAALATGKELPVSGPRGRRNLAIIAAARHATAQRRAIRVDAL